ncbi:MAG: Rrf2 family transcriptional regulator [Candidatus Eisenbacteria bacterium]|nr:Rrf2 family transcriptional regulator [Candidatus Eisenbacteria bacterium]MCC7140890.1 Rrf2 family transcriptional regulator [Candidatus Eisenbacteria bacterium]
MKISPLDEYGLRCMVQLARTGPDGALTIPELAEREGLSEAYVAKVMGLLKGAGLVHAARGRAGGYRLAAPPSEIAVAGVMSALGGPTWESVGCDRFNGAHEVCVHSAGCSIRSLWAALDAVIDQLLGNVTLADLLGGERLTGDRLRAMQERGLKPAGVTCAPRWPLRTVQSTETQEV